MKINGNKFEKIWKNWTPTKIKSNHDIKSKLGAQKTFQTLEYLQSHRCTYVSAITIYFICVIKKNNNACFTIGNYCWKCMPMCVIYSCVTVFASFHFSLRCFWKGIL